MFSRILIRCIPAVPGTDRPCTTKYYARTRLKSSAIVSNLIKTGALSAVECTRPLDDHGEADSGITDLDRFHFQGHMIGRG